MIKIGSEAPIGGLAQMGANAWGKTQEESDTVLFDGVVTLNEAGEGLGVFMGVAEGGRVPEVGVDYTIIINGNSEGAIAKEMDGAPVIQIISDNNEQILYGSNEGTAMFLCTSQYGHAGANTLMVVVTEDR